MFEFENFYKDNYFEIRRLGFDTDSEDTENLFKTIYELTDYNKQDLQDEYYEYGKEDGYEIGYSSGFDDAEYKFEEKLDREKSISYQEGYEHGQEDEKFDAESVYDKGFSDGYDSCKEDYDY